MFGVVAVMDGGGGFIEQSVGVCFTLSDDGKDESNFRWNAGY